MKPDTIPKNLRGAFRELLAHLKHDVLLREETRDSLICFIEGLPRPENKFRRKLEVAALASDAIEKFGNTTKAFEEVAKQTGVNLGTSSIREYYYQVKRIYGKVESMPPTSPVAPKDYEGPQVYVDGVTPILITSDAVYYFDRESMTTKVLRETNNYDLRILEMCLEHFEGEG